MACFVLQLRHPKPGGLPLPRARLGHPGGVMGPGVGGGAVTSMDGALTSMGQRNVVVHLGLVQLGLGGLGPSPRRHLLVSNIRTQ